MKKAIVYDEFTDQAICSIDIDNLPEKGESVIVIEDNNFTSYFQVERIEKENGETKVLLKPQMKEWFIGFQRLYGGGMNICFATPQYASVQNDYDVG